MVGDPNVFIGDDGQAYQYFGGCRKLGVVKLKEDMVARDGPGPEAGAGAWQFSR